MEPANLTDDPFPSNRLIPVFAMRARFVYPNSCDSRVYSRHINPFFDLLILVSRSAGFLIKPCISLPFKRFSAITIKRVKTLFEALMEGFPKVFPKASGKASRRPSVIQITNNKREIINNKYQRRRDLTGN